MEHILRDKNENISSGNSTVSTKNENSSSENLKENFYPKSLLEIASDTSTKFHLDASTPKISRKSSGSLKDNSFNARNNDSFTIQDNPAQNSSSLSFLANDLNNLKLKEIDLTVTDDEEEQFLSFNDMSNRQNNDSKDNLPKNDETLVLQDEIFCGKIEIEECSISEKVEIEKAELVVSTDQTATLQNNFIPENINNSFTIEKYPLEKQEPELEIEIKSNVVQEKENLLDQVFSPSHFETQTSEVSLNRTNTIETSLENASENDTQILNKEDESSNDVSMSIESDVPIQNDCADKNDEVKSINSSQNEIELRQQTSDSSSCNINFKSYDQPPPKTVVNIVERDEEVLQIGLNKTNNFTNETFDQDVSMLSIREYEDKSLKEFERIEFGFVKNETPPDNMCEAPESERLVANMDPMPTCDVNSEKPSNNSPIFLSDFKSSGRRSFDLNMQHSNVSPVLYSGSERRNSANSFLESFQTNLDIEFKMPRAPSSRKSMERQESIKNEFTSAISYNFGDSDFDFLQKFGSNSSDQNIGRDSVLLKFDPLLAKPVPVQSVSNFPNLPEEDDEQSTSLREESIQQELKDENTNSNKTYFPPIDEFPQLIPLEKDMNVEIMKDIAPENEKQISNLECEDIKISTIDHHENQDNNKFMELESKMRMEAEQREEVLLKRISEKDKQISKMNNVVKEYEKAIAELIAEKEQLVQSYEKKCADLKNDSEMNAQHLASLESTFSDLHVKYERTKQIAMDLKEREEQIAQDRKTLFDNLKMQEARYEKMKTHAMSQLEIANNKLAEMNRNHQAEVTKLKAQLKKEEISRASINEQLIQKSKENAELVKICDELIGNHGNSHTV